MMVITICSWLAVITVLVVYFKGSELEFAWANVLLFIPICLPALLKGAYSSVAVSIAFGIIAAWKLYRW